jgi:type IV pilus assembly protein PilQ
MKPIKKTNVCCLLFLLVLFGGCVSPRVSAPDPLSKAYELYEAGKYNEALLECAEISYRDPETPGLEDLRRRVLLSVHHQQASHAANDAELDRRRIALEAQEALKLPDRYGLRGTTEPLPMDQLDVEGPMAAQLDQPVSLSLQDVQLSGLIAALSSNLEINMIADPDVGAEKRLTIEATSVPLREILQYASRNLGVEFHVGESVIWVTGSEPEKRPLETRIYRLRQGIQMKATDWNSPDADAKKMFNDVSLLTQKATVPSAEKTTLEEIIEKMVPEQSGSAILFDRGSHTLFVRNSRENLKLISSIVEALDTTPPQILIEARFIEVIVDDLSELGIEWLLDSPWRLESKLIPGEDGELTKADKILMGTAGFSYTPYSTGEGGPHPLGPQGAFGMIESPKTAGQGLNLSIAGVLTDPAFSAVIHALQISGKGRTLSMPRVTTMNNNPAKLRSGQDLRFFEEFQAQAFSLVDVNNQKYTVTALIPKGSPSIEELGITLIAVPSVGADREKITLLLNPSISSLEGYVSYQDDSTKPSADDSRTSLIRQVVVKLPVFTRREVATKLTVRSGDTVVMGGLIDSIDQDTVHKIPILGDIPIFGHLFRRTGTTEQRRNLLIFVTATVISDRGESLVSPSVDIADFNRETLSEIDDNTKTLSSVAPENVSINDLSVDDAIARLLGNESKSGDNGENDLSINTETSNDKDSDGGAILRRN